METTLKALAVKAYTSVSAALNLAVTKIKNSVIRVRAKATRWPAISDPGFLHRSRCPDDELSGRHLSG